MKYISNLTELQFTVPNDIKTVLTVSFSELRKIMADASLSIPLYPEGISAESI